MFNILIVDDNQIVLDGLVKFIDWNELGYKVAGVATSAADAMKIIETEYVDVILSDIVMPGKTGFDLIKEAQQINPIIKSVILSSFGEFKYAQEAMRMGAYDYLVKPVNFDELKKIFNSLKTILENEILEKQKLGEYRSITHTQFMNNIVNKYFNNIEEIREKAFKIGLQLYDNDFCLIRIYIDENPTADQNVEEKDFAQILGNIKLKIQIFLENYGKAYLFNYKSLEIGVLFYPNTENEEKLENILDKLDGALKIFQSSKVFLGISCIYHDILDVSQSFEEAGKALEYRYIKKGHTLLYFKHFSELIKDEPVIHCNQEKPMGMAIENVIRYINEHYNENITLQRLSEIAYVHPIYLSKLFKNKSGENFIDYLMKVRVENAKKLLSNLSYHIYDVGQMVGYESPKHFSKVFKEITGITPKDYRNKF